MATINKAMSCELSGFSNGFLDLFTLLLLPLHEMFMSAAFPGIM